MRPSSRKLFGCSPPLPCFFIAFIPLRLRRALLYLFFMPKKGTQKRAPPPMYGRWGIQLCGTAVQSTLSIISSTPCSGVLLPTISLASKLAGKLLFTDQDVLWPRLSLWSLNTYALKASDNLRLRLRKNFLLFHQLKLKNANTRSM